MTLDELRVIAVTILRNKSAEVKIYPEQWGLLMKFASLKHFKRKLGLPEEYQPGRPLPLQIPEISTRITMDLSVFKCFMGRAGYPKLVINKDGEAAFPPGFFYPLSATYVVIEKAVAVSKDIEFLTDKEWSERMASKIIIPSKHYPVANIQSRYIRFAPKNLQSVEFTYLQTPADPVYAFTTTSGYVKYDPVNSVELQWDELNQIDILYMLLSDLGVSVSRGDILQVSEKVKTQGI